MRGTNLTEPICEGKLGAYFVTAQAISRAKVFYDETDGSWMLRVYLQGESAGVVRKAEQYKVAPRAELKFGSSSRCSARVQRACLRMIWMRSRLKSFVHGNGSSHSQYCWVLKKAVRG